MPFLREAAAMDFGLPEPFPRLAMVAEHRLNLVFVVGGREEHLISHHRRRTMTASRNRAFPQDVFRFAPLQRRLLRRRSNAVAVRPPPPRPVRGGEADSIRVRSLRMFFRVNRGSREKDQPCDGEREQESLHGEALSRRDGE